MATIKDQALCIRQWDFSETSQTVSLLGRETGLFRAIAKGSRRPKSSFSGGIDLLTRGDVVAIIKPGRELATLTEWGLSRIWWRIRRDVHANRVAYFMSDCASRMLDLQDPHPGVFDGLVQAMDQIENGDPSSCILTRFLLVLLSDTGYRPRFDHVELGTDGPDSMLFSPQEGGLVEGVEVPGTWRVRSSTIEVLKAFQQGADHEQPFHERPEATNRAAKLLAAYLRELLGSEPPTLSLVFPDLAGGRV
ncbi:MAG: DNA repair protein RecO [Planctomycetota bacterium]|nr:DNA repair protein RecO [Planctomycetota bacterium]